MKVFSYFFWLYSFLLYLVLIYLITMTACLAMESSHSYAQQLAGSLLGSVQGIARTPDLSSVPGYATDRPKESSFNVATLGDAALAETHTSEAGQFLKTATAERKRFVLDPDTDPLLRNADEVLKDPHTVLDVKLETGTEEKGAAVLILCEEAGDSIEQACHHSLNIEISITPGYITESWICGGYDVPWYADHGGSANPCYGKPKRYMRHSHGPNNPGCLRGHRPCAKDYQRQDHPEIITITKEEWRDDCAALEDLTDKGLCQYVNKVCSDGPSTKMIQDRPIIRDCWQFRQTYRCKKSNKNTCSALRAKGCLQKSSRCKEFTSGVCVVWEQTYECPSMKRSLKNIRTGVGSPFCITGNCVDSSYQANGEMLEVMAKLSVFKEMQKDIRSGNFEIFKGHDKRCSRNCIDFKDCCQNMKGWGTSMHLASCSAEEKLLAELKSKNLCHQVGIYCAKKVLGICVSKKTSYCCFGNKLLRLIQEQGRAQLGIGWGTAETPVCRGLRPEELSRIDFSRLDLSEVFEDIMASIKAPNAASLQTVTAERLKDNLRHIQAGTRKQPLITGEAGAL
ncbi:MAG: conjugal transfer protein TraN [Alphaproteobacteria bacterium]|nr:conjugal transfer protein TraN [Alphaproteobacteria bacterium]